MAARAAQRRAAARSGARRPHLAATRRAFELERGLVEEAAHFFLLPYGLWFVGFNETCCFVACERTAPSVRPSLSPITRVGVFPFARSRSAFLSPALQSLPVLR